MTKAQILRVAHEMNRNKSSRQLADEMNVTIKEINVAVTRLRKNGIFIPKKNDEFRDALAELKKGELKAI